MSYSTTPQAQYDLAVARDQDILHAAARLFYSRGYDAVGVDEIGAAAGVTGPAIYRHFSGKEDILVALFDSAMDRLLQLAGHFEDDPHAELEALIDAQIAFALDDRELLSIYAREDRSLSAPARRRLHRRQRRYVDRWVDALGRRHPDAGLDDRRATAHAMIGLVLSIASWPRTALDTPALPDLVRSLVLGGIDALARGDGVPAGAPARSRRE